MYISGRPTMIVLPQQQTQQGGWGERGSACRLADRPTDRQTDIQTIL